jgi:adenylosuccinate lyase
MKLIWGQHHKYETWLEIIATIAQHQAAEGLVPPEFCEHLWKCDISLASIECWEQIYGHDVVAFLRSIEEQLSPEMKPWLHRGLTSSDIVDTSNSIILKECYTAVSNAYIQVICEIRSLIEKIGKQLRIARTHGVPAEESTWEHLLLSHSSEFDRAILRLKSAKTDLPGKVSGTTGKFISKRVQELVMTDLKLMTTHCTQVVPRDFYIEYIYSLAMLMNAAERIATNFRLMVLSGECVLEHLGEAGSSAMPHKVNPIRFEKIVSISRLVRSQLSTMMESNNLWLDRDLTHSASDRIIFESATSLTEHGLQALASALSQVHKFKLVPVSLTGLQSSQRLFDGATTGIPWSERHKQLMNENGDSL